MRKVLVIFIIFLALFCFSGCKNEVVNDLEGQVSILKVQKESLDDRLTEYTNDLNNLKEKIEILKKENEELKNKVNLLETDVSDKNNEITNLKKDIKELEEQLDTIDDDEPNWRL